MTSKQPNAPQPMTRRRLLRGLATGMVVGPLIACADDSRQAGDGGTDSESEDGPSSSAGTETESSAGTDTSDGDAGDTETSDSEDCGDASEWASGGTVAMTEKDCYPDPFTGAVASCALLCETTEGPCTATTIERQDVSEGWSGLPVRLALKFVYADSCEPIEGAVVEIWHTQRTGVYSGVTPSGAFCYGDDPEAENHLYFRGSQTTDATGRVDFDTCYPGWYSGRAIHIHFRVYLGGENLIQTSQLFFTEALTEEIFATHPEYVEFGQPNTVNSNDNIIGGEDDISPYLLDTERMPDGAMLAWKLIAVRSSANDTTCTAGGGMGGPP